MISEILSSFAKAPFHLEPTDLEWIETQFAALDNAQKAALIFSVMSLGPELDVESLKKIQPGFITRIQAGGPDHQMAQLNALNDALTIPAIVSSDLEGSSTSLPEGILTPNPMSFAAANDPDLTERAAFEMGVEANHYGIGWSFTPAIDLNLAFRSAVVGTRSFGSDMEKVRAQGLATMRGLQKANVAATAKHWPGEGVDARDQHLVTTINDMGFEEWKETYGSLYQSVIDEGILSIMSAHVALPAYMKDVQKIDGPEAYLPASLNKHLNEDLLRKEMGFQGVIVSDATLMAGVTNLRRRDDLVVDVFNAGCDVILGVIDLGEDVAAITGALESGKITQERLDTAILRQLALKAALGVHRDRFSLKTPDPAPLNEVLQKAPTLVKTHDGLLPLTPEKYRKVYIVSRGVGFPPASPTQPLPLVFKDMLKEAGFEVVEHEWGTPVDPTGCDLLIYVYAEETLLTRGTISNDWAPMNGDFIASMRRHWHEIPSLMISFGWPYHLYEAPQVQCYVNAYMSHPAMQSVTLEALMGKHAFEGVSPVDPFCGLEESYFAL